MAILNGENYYFKKFIRIIMPTQPKMKPTTSQAAQGR